MNLAEIIKNNPVYSHLKKDIFKETSSKILFDVVKIYQVPYSFQSSLIEALSDDFQKGFVYVTRENLDTLNYLKTIQLIDLLKTPLIQLIKIVLNHNYQRVLKVLNPSEFSVSGDILTIWPIGYEHPIRMSYFGDEFESADLIDEVYNKSYSKLNELLIGDLNELPEKTIYNNITVFNPSQKFLRKCLVFSNELIFDDDDEKITFDFSYPQLYFQRFDNLERDIQQKESQGYIVQLLTENFKSLPKSLQKYKQKPIKGLDSGIESKSQKLFFLTDRELFGTIFLNKVTKRLTTNKARQMLADFEGEIEIDDYIVHEDYGIGIYKGIKQEEFVEKISLGFGEYTTKVTKEDYIFIKYADSDELYIPLTAINKITKYIAPDGQVPELTKLGKNEWANLRRKVKSDIALVAKDLVELYAKRALSKAPNIKNNDDDLYEQFIDDFKYESTPDQLRAEKEVLADLLIDQPMNRLIVGDVGFGKTEVAMRAAFKVCQSGFQVAVLCPTTVLTAQHEKVFTDRFKNTKYKVKSLSRLSKYSNDLTLLKLFNGEIDIIIGTHRLLSSDVQFKNLGLLIIDEEQKFGVKQKEKLKKLAKNVHVLNLSATPIPRTLSMALSSIQEISIIETPPKNRQAIKTYVSKIDWSKIVSVIESEVSRGGQVYFLHNKVKTIDSVKFKLQKLMPHVRFITAHGQMPPNDLSERINDFYEGKFHFLICTTIIENGIDMPNVNTIIIEHAQNFGLGQLYQLRGRVGRSDKQAYAYMFYEGSLESPDQVDDEKKIAEKKYVKRLKAILESSDLGSGFKLASKDLEIRGAGNLLGKAQHGHIKFMGYGLYMQLLAEEIERQKSELSI